MNDQPTPTASLKWYQQAGIVAALVCVGVASRWVMVDWPNFKPILAIAIFCGFLSTRRWPVLIAIAAMAILSDALLGFYDWRLMASVYVSLMLACCAGALLTGWLHRSQSLAAKLTGIVGTSLAASTVFFLMTNAATWWIGWYPAGWTGLLESLSAGIPFFRFALLGDLVFSMLLFSTWFAVVAWAAGRRKTSATRGYQNPLPEQATVKTR